MSGSIHVRRIRSDEGMSLMEIRLAALLDAPFAFESTYESSALRPMDHWVSRARAAADGTLETVVVAEWAGRLVGMAGAFPEGDDRVLYGMWVEPGHRRRGIAARLTRAIIGWARSTGAQTLRLWVVEDNAAALRLYHKHGFEGTGERKAMPGRGPVELEMALGLSGE